MNWSIVYAVYLPVAPTRFTVPSIPMWRMNGAEEIAAMVVSLNVKSESGSAARRELDCVASSLHPPTSAPAAAAIATITATRMGTRFKSAIRYFRWFDAFDDKLYRLYHGGGYMV